VNSREEVAPGSNKDPCKWEVFLETCREIGYDGLLSHEQCSPIIMRKGHTLGDGAEVDRRYAAAIGYFKPLLKK
jgi:sugar phosphate isomerase/epimerase